MRPCMSPKRHSPTLPPPARLPVVLPVTPFPLTVVPFSFLSSCSLLCHPVLFSVILNEVKDLLFS